jgi:hypothetical protein
MDEMIGRACVASTMGVFAVAAGVQAAVWTTDPLVKVFRDDPAPKEPAGAITLCAARGEYESAQVCLRAAAAVAGAQVVPGDLRAEGATIPAAAISWNPVGYIPVGWNTYHTPERELLRRAPFDAPDPLLPAAPIDVAADSTQPFWITIHVPGDAAPGQYSGALVLRWTGGEATMPLSLTVWPFALPADCPLTFTNWISPAALAKHHKVELESDAFYTVLGNYAHAAAEHYQNVMWVSLSTVRIAQSAAGELRFDFTHFDRWVETVSANGCGRLIEIQPLGRWADGWDSTDIALHDLYLVGPDGTAKTLAAAQCLPTLLPALEAHLRERGWLERTVLHIADEPAVHHVAAWRQKSDWVHSLAPGIRRIDAIEAPDFGTSLEIWVPKLNHLYNWLAGYQRAQARGAELWFYTCCHPTASYPNRFLDFPLLSTRLLQWYNWRYRLSGYLHWGLNFWNDEPLASAGSTDLPPGDCWIVYPGPDGRPLSSIRWEALRDGFEDYQYLRLLAECQRRLAADLGAPPELFDPEQRSDEFATELVRTVVQFCRDPLELRRVREAIATDISRSESRPRALVTTLPPTSQPLAGWPIVVETRVWAEAGTEVKVNGQPAHRQPQGHWAHHTFLTTPAEPVRVELTKDGVTRTEERRFAAVEAASPAP